MSVVARGRYRTSSLEGFYKEKGHPLLEGLLILRYALGAWRYALLFLQCHLDVTAGTLFGAKTAPFAEIQVEFVQPRFL